MNIILTSLARHFSFLSGDSLLRGELISKVIYIEGLHFCFCMTGMADCFMAIKNKSQSFKDHMNGRSSDKSHSFLEKFLFWPEHIFVASRSWLGMNKNVFLLIITDAWLPSVLLCKLNLSSESCLQCPCRVWRQASCRRTCPF